MQTYCNVSYIFREHDEKYIKLLGNIVKTIYNCFKGNKDKIHISLQNINGKNKYIFRECDDKIELILRSIMLIIFYLKENNRVKNAL